MCACTNIHDTCHTWPIAWGMCLLYVPRSSSWSPLDEIPADMRLKHQDRSADARSCGITSSLEGMARDSVMTGDVLLYIPCDGTLENVQHDMTDASRSYIF